MKFNFKSIEKQILDDISMHGRVYLVGGIVRDMLLYGDVDYHDVDVEVYDLDVDELEDILSKYGSVNKVGKNFGILKLKTLPHFDFALPRMERKNGKGHQDFEVTVKKDMELYTASSRRDFTINALMYDYKEEKIIDLHGGLDDLSNKILKMVDETTFQEDPLRVLRLAQFVSRLEFGVDKKTKQICKKMVEEGSLEYLSKERIMEEYNKLLMSSIPSLGIIFLKEIGALFKPLQDLVDCYQRPDFHPEGSVMNHTLLVVDLAALCKQKTSWPLAFMWGALLHDIGKPAVTTPQGRAPGHNESGVKVFHEYFDEYFKNKKMKKYVETMIFYHMHLMNMARHQAPDYRFYWLLKQIDGIMPVYDLVYISKCDKAGRTLIPDHMLKDLDVFMEDRITRLGDQALKPLIKGQDLIDLGFKEKREYKELLDWAYDLQMRGHDLKSIIDLLKGKRDGR